MLQQSSISAEKWRTWQKYIYISGLLCGIFALITPTLQAQSKVDSLTQILRESRGTQRAKVLLKLADYSRQQDMQKGISQVKEALQIAIQQDAEELQTTARQKLGWFYSIISQDTTALEQYLLGLRMERQHGHRLKVASMLHSIGRFYMKQGNYAQSLNYFLQALRIWQDEGKKFNEAVTLKYIGELYSLQNKFQQSADFYEQAYQLTKAFQKYSQMAMNASGAAYALQSLKRYGEAISYFEKALKAADQINSVHKIHAKAGILIGMSSVYQDQSLYDKAIDLLQQQLKLARDNESKILLARGYENLSGVLAAKGNIEQSNKYLIKAIALKKELGISTTASLNELAQNYLAQQTFSQSITTAVKALALAKESGTLQNQSAILETLIQAYIGNNNYQQASKTQTQLAGVNSRIFNETKSRQIAEMQTRYKTNQKEQEIALLQKKQENALLLRNALIVGILLFVIIGFLIYMRQRLKITKNETELENTGLKQHQLKQDIEFKNKQLTTHSLNLVQKNEIMKELKQAIGEVQKNKNGKNDKKLRDLQHMVDYSFNLDEDWENFRHYFEDVHTGFFKALKGRSPDLTTNELRLSALVKLNLTIKEIATILSISPDSVKTARYRLRKKLDLETEQDLSEFMMHVEEKAANSL